MSQKRSRPPSPLSTVALAVAFAVASPAALAVVSPVDVTSLRATGYYQLGSDTPVALLETLPPNFGSVDVLSFPYSSPNSAGLHSYGSTGGDFGSRSSGYGIYDVSGSFRIVETITNFSSAAQSASFNFYITPGLLSNYVGASLTGSDFVSSGLTFDIRRGNTSIWGSSATLTTDATHTEFNSSGINLYSGSGTYYTVNGGGHSIDLGVINAGESIQLSYELDTFAKGSSSAGDPRHVEAVTYHVPAQWVSCYGGDGYGYGNTFTSGGCINGQMLVDAHDVTVPAHDVPGTASGSHASSGDPFEVDFNNGSPNFGKNTNAGFASTTVLAAVPEPSTYALLLAGMGLVAWAARRRRPGAPPAQFAAH